MGDINRDGVVKKGVVLDDYPITQRATLTSKSESKRHRGSMLEKFDD